MVAELTARFTSSEEFLQKMLVWVDSSASTVEPSWYEKMNEVADDEVTFGSDDPEAPTGPPGGVLARVTTVSGSGNFISTVRYRGESTRRWLQADKTDLKRVFFEVHKLDSLGFLSDGFSLNCSRVGDGSGWLRASMNFRESETIANPERISRRLTALKRFAESQEVGFGHVSYLYNPLSPTAYEEALNIDPEHSITQYPGLARGYSWITVLPREILEVIGGAGAMRECGLFSEVNELANGAYWLQAAVTWSDYLHADFSSLQRVFAPILIPGDPVRDDLSGTSAHFPPQLVAFS
ncbi:hypothetical protein ACFV2H_44750 [Streptomyces sp. NPDC059629]|uniref:hypothetical protein n=1 Tax=Streptomyces sp. NPDC059629 TaxID=3346889 RepID=UPI003689D7EB